MEENLNQREDLSGVMRRVAKLLAIAEDPRANPNEAAAAAGQAEKIMRKYQIENADVIRASLDRGTATMGMRRVRALMKRDNSVKGHRPQKVPPWAWWLAFRIAKLNDCELRFDWQPLDGAGILFCGFEADTEVCAFSFDYLCGAMIFALRRWQKEAPRGKAESESYRRGFILALAAKLQAAKTEKDAEMQLLSSSRALVVSKAGAIVAHFGEFTYGKARSINLSDRSAFERGREAGSKIDVHRRGVEHSASKTLKIN
jgi:hypothetical protein